MQIFRNTHTIAILLYTGAFITSPAHAQPSHSPAITGFLGLNTVPNARMDEVGTMRIGTSALSPYMHSYIGVQIAEPLYINIRQTAQTSSPLKTAEKLYPGVDFKLRILKENAHLPEISLGVQSALGHKKMAAEYIALSKRYNNLDFTAGLGWGRFGTAGHFDNPLKKISSHFTKPRNQNSEEPNTPSNWFTGNSIGFFAGIEYFTPYDGLSLKLDYGADDYNSEQANIGYNQPSPWGLGMSYTYNNFANISLAAQGTDKIMGSLSLKSKPSKWPLTHKKYSKPKPFYQERPARINITAIKQSAENDGIILENIQTSGNSIYATLNMDSPAPAPQQIGRAARHISTYSGQNIEEINIVPARLGLRSQTVKIMRKDVENSVGNNGGSPQEIWKNAEFVTTDKGTYNTSAVSSTKWINNKNSWKISLENQLSLSEEDSGSLYRSSIIIEQRSSPFLGFLTGTAMRINLGDNLDNISKLRPAALNPVRSDIAAFTNERISLESTFLGYSHSFSPALHTLIVAGYLEEFYSGYGGEILYRPPASRIAIGAEIWSAARRDPYTSLNLGLNGANTVTGHLNGWYDLPNHDVTLGAKIGRFLAGDVGGSLSLEKIFKNGAKLSSSITLSNYSEPDLFGGTTHAYHAINLSLPLGSIPYIPEGSEIKTKIAPFGRDIGQTLNPPLRLFEMSENLTLDHMAKHWKKILD